VAERMDIKIHQVSRGPCNNRGQGMSPTFVEWGVRQYTDHRGGSTFSQQLPVLAETCTTLTLSFLGDPEMSLQKNNQLQMSCVYWYYPKIWNK